MEGGKETERRYRDTVRPEGGTADQTDRVRMERIKLSAAPVGAPRASHMFPKAAAGRKASGQVGEWLGLAKHDWP